MNLFKAYLMPQQLKLLHDYSCLLSQAAIHMTEHKGEIATILKQHGFHINLNELMVSSVRL